MTDAKPWPGAEIVRRALIRAKSAKDAFNEAYGMAEDEGLSDLECASIGRTAQRDYLIGRIEAGEGAR